MLLAVFPLQLVLFPGETIPLHIFEPRYKQLIADCRDESIRFGLPTFISGRLSQFGTEAELINVFRTYDNGEMDVLVRGVRVFQVKELVSRVPGKLYSGAIVAYPENNMEYDETVRDTLLRRLESLMRLKEIEIDMDDFSDGAVSYRIAPLVDLTLPQKIEMVSTLSERERQSLLLKHIETRIKTQRDPHNSDAMVGRLWEYRGLRVSRN